MDSDSELVVHERDGITFQIASDLHLCFKRKSYSIPHIADYLFLCGDLETYYTHFFFLEKFLAKHAKQFKKVIWIMGNHEMMVFGFKTINYIVYKCRVIAQKTNTVFLFNESYEIIPGLQIIGSPLLSHVPTVPHVSKSIEKAARWSHFTLIHVCGGACISHIITNNEINEFHEECNRALIRELELCKKEHKKAIVMTHYLPLAPFNTKEKRDKDFSVPRRYGCCNTDKDMEDVLKAGKDVISLWIFGHDHRNTHFTYTYEDETKFEAVSNQLGAYGEKNTEANFKPDRVFRVTL